MFDLILYLQDELEEVLKLQYALSYVSLFDISFSAYMLNVKFKKTVDRIDSI